MACVDARIEAADADTAKSGNNQRRIITVRGTDDSIVSSEFFFAVRTITHKPLHLT